MIGYFPEELQTGFDQNAAWHLKKQSQRPVTVKVLQQALRTKSLPRVSAAPAYSSLLGLPERSASQVDLSSPTEYFC